MLAWERRWNLDDADNSTFTWKNLDYTVKANGKDLQLLDKVSGYCKAGTLTALVCAVYERSDDRWGLRVRERLP